MLSPELAQAVRAAVAETLAAVPPERIAYTIEQAAEAVGLARNTIRDAVSRGELRAVKRCGRWLIKRDSLLRWLADS